MTSTQRTRNALLPMAIAVVCYSLTFPTMEFADGGRNPLTFGAAWNLGFGVGSLAFLAVRHHRTLRRPETLRAIMGRIPTWAFLMTGVSETALYPLIAATRFIDEATAAIFTETWTIIMVVMAAVLFRHDRRFSQTPRCLAPIMLAGLAGFSLVTLGQTGLEPTHQEIARTAIGIALSLTGAAAIGMSAFAMRWGADLAGSLPGGRGHHSLEIMGTVTGQCLVNLAMAGPGWALGILAGESPSMAGIAPALVIGVSVFTVATIMWDRASLTTRNLGIHTMPYAIPILRPVYIQPRG